MSEQENTNLLIEDIDPSVIPDKFKDQQSGMVKLGALVKSYGELEQKMSSRPKTPASPQDYCIDCEHGLFEPDAHVNAKLHERGFTQEQAQAVYDLAAEKMVPMIRDIIADVSAEREIEKLIEHFGGADQWKEVSRQLLSFGTKSLPADVLDTLSSSFEGVLALHRMMESGEPHLKRASSKAGQANANDLQSMMRDPRYWKDKDPAFIEKVTQGFEKLYGE